MDLQIASDLMQLCSTREYGLHHIRKALSKGYSTNTILPDDTSYLLLLFLEQEFPWKLSTDAEDMKQILHDTDATRFAMAMVQRGVHDIKVVARIFTNLMCIPDLDPRTSHVLCNILHLIDVDALVDCLFSTTSTGTTDVKHRLCAATTVSKRTRLRTCRNAIQLLRDAKFAGGVH
tara:strand:+ start:2491 stop:3018 length:528 start_codon:yes stop_codon:yes gene_type:complete